MPVPSNALYYRSKPGGFEDVVESKGYPIVRRVTPRRDARGLFVGGECDAAYAWNAADL